MTKPGRSRRTIILISAAVLLAAGVAVLFYLNDQSAKRRQAEIVAAREQIALKNRGIGFVENAQYAEADAAFSTLAGQLPGESLGWRNLAVTRLLAVESLTGAEHTPQELQAANDAANAAVGELLKRVPDSSVAHLLAAEAANQAKDEAGYADELEAAAALAPGDAVIHFKLYLALRYAGDEAALARAHAALRKAASLAPDNLFVQTEWLGAQSRSQDAEIGETLEHLRRLLAPFAKGIEANSRFDVLAAIDDMRGAAERNDWPTIVGRAAGLGNVVRPEAMTHIDRGRINPHLLEFLAFDFSDQFYEAADLPPPAAPAAIDVRFVRDEQQQLPKIARVRAVEAVDFNLDGNLEIVVLADAAVSVWQRDPPGDGWTESAALELPAGMRGLVAADLDRDDKETPPREPTELAPCLDADVDLLVWSAAGIVVLRNQLDRDSGKRTLEPVLQDEAFSRLTDVLAVALADVDHDGDLDLIVSSASGVSIWSNRDDFTFADISDRSALPPAEFRATTTVAVDWNRDAAIDLLLADAESGRAGYLENQMHGRLRWRPFEADFGLPAKVASIDVAELDGNASWDLVSSGPAGIGVLLTTTPDSGSIKPLGHESLSSAPAARLLTCDFDNDGYRDVVAWNADKVSLLRGLPGGRFEPAQGVLDVSQQQIADCAAADLDGDGDEDLLVASAAGVTIYRNDGGNVNGWIDVALSADPNRKPPDASKRVNMHGIGSLLELKAGSSYQAQVVRRKTTHFGLGPLERADVVRVLWTNGIPENRVDAPRNLAICAKQDLKGSCPYLYTWDGERYVFATDLLWASPIGLQLSEGVLAPAREWEYLLVSGEKLKPIEGEYRLQITEELWEAAYFDCVRLIAVDHPAEVDVYTNEKVGPAAIAEHKIHTVRNPRIPVSARDKHGRDVLPPIAERDDEYLRPFDGRINQGLVDEHFVELDLGPLDDPQQITLFLTGWVFPTDTSLNVAISHNPNVTGPRPPYIEVPDGNGGWREAIAYTGFPGGKTKTIAVDVSGIFPEGDYRLRIATSMELCWDQMFFTVDEEPAEFETHELPLVAADLHYRGFNRRVEHRGHGPESYDYDDFDPLPKWPPMAGRFTRYGNAAPLVRSEDDRLVVMGAGDEMTLRFRAPAETLRRGWERDFVLYNVGWDKDADLNTVYGQTVEPLPFRAMRRYPFAPEQSEPDAPEYRAYLRTYQTRQQSAGRFWKALAQ